MLDWHVADIFDEVYHSAAKKSLCEAVEAVEEVVEQGQNSVRLRLTLLRLR